MGRNNYFQFKQFKIIQEKAAMKVGTDGVLLGAWVNTEKVKTALDVGTGTGLISLMIAQRSNADITGIEIEKNAAYEATENIKNSEWGNRISIHHISFQEFVKNTTDTFDLIVSNPPFFSNAVKNNNQNLSIARHNDFLPFQQLISGSVKLLNNFGRLAVVLPLVPAQEFIKTAHSHGLHLIRKMEIKPAPFREPNRVLMEFGQNKMACKTENISILKENGFDYSNEYKILTSDFYLNF